VCVCVCVCLKKMTYWIGLAYHVVLFLFLLWFLVFKEKKTEDAPFRAFVELRK
jgi:hypothetical protein